MAARAFRTNASRPSELQVDNTVGYSTRRVIRRVSHLTLVLAAAAVFLAPAALAGGAKPKKHHKGVGNCVSAVCVYHEDPTSLSGGSSKGPPVPLSAAALAALQKLGGKDTRALLEMATSRAFGVAPPRPGQAAAVGGVGAPSTLLAALDLGPGPIALFVTLLAGAAAFALGGALRRRRNAA
ncbi:MAG TPA: hypothetical protein VFA37_05925 [Gaiellaceae bacterium]|nr:hypothetical protein [Gaiellaceae bacterium]